jgi:hypothetical protein
MIYDRKTKSNQKAKHFDEMIKRWMCRELSKNMLEASEKMKVWTEQEI